MEAAPRVYMIGDGSLSGSGDCCVFTIGLANGGTCMIDAGTSNAGRVLANLAACPLRSTRVDHLVLTHCHYDHAGAAHQLVTRFPAMNIIAHEADAPAIEGAPGTASMTAASWYGESYQPVRVGTRLLGGRETLVLDGTAMEAIHAPGHTPGSIVVLLDASGTRVLFGQDIHGPFSPEFRSDIDAWARSMDTLIGLEADVLCEGHYGVITGKGRVRRFIEEHIARHGRGGGRKLF